VITRRQTLIALAAVASTAPLPLRAQDHTRVWRIGFLGVRRPAAIDTDVYGEFVRGMRELGYVEGKNLKIEWRFAEDYERLPKLAAELVQLKVHVIVATPSPAIRAAQRATTTIPIVFPTTGDPVGSGFVASLARPGGNITGVTNNNLDVSGKLLELLSTIAHNRRVAVLGNPGSSTHAAMVTSIRAAAQQYRLELISVTASKGDEIDRAFEIIAQQRAGAVVIAADGFLVARAEQIAALATKYRLPSINQSLSYAEEHGGLLSYGTDTREGYRRAATYVDKIIKGARPADLPVQQPTRFQLIVNLKTARAIGVTIAPSLLISADKVIE
jgi:putative tryptophan/tyrosine transport system substrate-binding protein